MKGIEIRKPEQLKNITSLIIPGGESTTMAKLAEYHNLVSSPFSPFLDFLNLFAYARTYRLDKEMKFIYVGYVF